MIEAIKECFTDLKADMQLFLREYGIFPVFGICFIYLMLALISLPFFLVGLPFYLLNEKSKSWGLKSSDPDLIQEEVPGDE